MKKIFILALAASVLAACEKDESCTPPSNPNVDPQDLPAVISVSPLIAGLSPSLTRTAYAGSTASWANNDAIGVFCPQAKGTSAANVSWTVTGLPSTPLWAAATTMYWADATTSHKFLAYAPYAAGNSSSSAVKLPSLAGQNGTLNAAQDFLYSNDKWSSGVQRSGGAVALTFTHALSLIEFDVTVNSSVATGSTLTSFVLGSATAGDKLYATDGNSTIDLSSGTITTTGGTTSNTQTVTPSPAPVLSTTSTLLHVLMLPGTFTAPTLAITINEAGTSLALSSVSLGTTQFEPGKKYAYTVTISRTAITLSSPTITNWITVTSGTNLTPSI